MELSALQDLERALWPFAALAVGRSVLALLPAGRIGSHAKHELAFTVVVSSALGSAALALAMRVGEALGMPWVAWWTCSVVPVLALALRASGPAAFAPGSDCKQPEPSAPVRVARGAGWLAALSPLWWACADESRWLNAFAASAVYIAGLRGSRAARRAEFASTLVAAALAGCVAWFPTHTVVGGVARVAVALGAACSILWLRRADRRARALALVAWSCTAWVAPAIGLAGGLALLVGTHPRERRSTLVAALVAALACALPMAATRCAEETAIAAATRGSTEALSPWLVSCAGAWTLAASVAWLLGFRARVDAARGPEPLEPSLESKFLGWTLAGACALHALAERAPLQALRTDSTDGWSGLLMLLAPLSAALVSLGLPRAERP
ncbi:MAG: hypothetical protein IT454_12055 [Planctomycetes bacterium]|nr:hypothetical protein [Planctomycetota bacterium]